MFTRSHNQRKGASLMEVRDPDVLRAAIAASGLSYAAVARYAGLKSRQFIHQLATGKNKVCNPTAAKLIAGAVLRPLDDLFMPIASADERHSGRQPQTAA